MNFKRFCILCIAILAMTYGVTAQVPISNLQTEINSDNFFDELSNAYATGNLDENDVKYILDLVATDPTLPMVWANRCRSLNIQDKRPGSDGSNIPERAWNWLIGCSQRELANTPTPYPYLVPTTKPPLIIEPNLTNTTVPLSISK